MKVADTHGIVYTPQPIVDFMCASVAEVLETEFGKGLGEKGVHILDPCTGTGNFIVNLMRLIPKSALRHKYRDELHCNELMLLPYYVASTPTAWASLFIVRIALAALFLGPLLFSWGYQKLGFTAYPAPKLAGSASSTCR